MLALRAACRLRWWPLWGAAVWVLGESARGSVPVQRLPVGPAGPHADRHALRGVRPAARRCPAPARCCSSSPACWSCWSTAAAWRTRGRAVAGGRCPRRASARCCRPGWPVPTAHGRSRSCRATCPASSSPGRRGEIFKLHAAETEQPHRPDRQPARCRSPTWCCGRRTPRTSTRSTTSAVRRRIESLVGDARRPDPGRRHLRRTTTVDTAYNAGVVWDADGPGERYVKRKPVPFGEYVPFRSALGGFVHAVRPRHPARHAARR